MTAGRGTIRGCSTGRPGPTRGWATACGYPGVVRLRDGELLCVFHTDFVDNDCEIRAVRLREVI